ncbi:unnamed protein product [Cylicocyclus nassatus]|uniref:Phlebovirus glycoprotein G2 fusion domain-containing protein n=1 Tax=Cylicocyclus nassatus TaxID=53992 RepID=A0AA36HB33_CYLNA|nr:unnamed protein product [Cylicocyclus nassatus]
MALIFHKKPIELSSKTLQSLLDKYASYSEEVKASGTEEEQYDEYLSAANLISGGIDNLKMSRNALQSLIDKLQKEYDEARAKGNKKELVNEVEEIEKDTGFTEKIAKANELIYILNARATEARNQMGKLARKLGINKEEPKKAKPTLLHEINSPQQATLESGVAEQMEVLTIAPEDASWLTEENTPSMRSREDDEDVICRTLKPKQLKVPQKLCEKWNLTLQEVNNASIKVPRLLLQSTFNSSKVSLWVFCDASKMAVATCAYLRCESSNKVSQLISGKSKLTPKKTQQTIPRLELLGILIALRMANNILQAITTQLCAINIASDSEIALFWIKSSRKLPTFVSNQKERISKLKAHLESRCVPVHFYHIATQHNPADVGTRGITAMAGSEHDWVRGPKWLENDPQSWLLKSIDSLRSDYSYEEIDDKKQVAAEIIVDAPLPSRVVIDLQRFSRYKTALRTFARVGKLLKRWTQRCNQARVYYATRCAEAGSCTYSKCSRLRPDEIVPELNASSHFPGYSMCDATCGGIVCGCLLPVPACTFLRIAHVPISDTVYEIVNCIEWKPVIQIEMDFMLYNKGKIKQFDLEPYLMHKHEEISLTVISIVKPHSPLMDKRFALSSRESIILPDYYQLPVECDSEETAAEHFANCTNRMICSCENFKAPQSCQCPPNSLQSLRKQVANVFPIHTSFTEINVEGNDVYAFSKEAEITLAIQSNLMIGGAQYVIDQPCKISAGKIKGCYSCNEGAKIELSCEAVEDSWVTVQCEHHVFSIECGPTNTSTQLSLDFDHAIISENCFVTCGEMKKTVLLDGLLNYHPGVMTNTVSQTDAKELAGGNPFYDIDMPDLSPLIDTLKAHWKLAIATFGVTAVLVGMTYLFGPSVVFLIAKVTISVAIAVVKIALHITRSVVTTLARVISILLCRSRE